ncbi:MAPEG family protein [uncultured Reyranella sp.]|uniref:MAPEG family protein n=1 Tax=uncultured Reyranella sp. TaxID=735512 RepID=UPI0025D0A86D|nr:MAPEG family protein [uncultured Reyranella sp.]
MPVFYVCAGLLGLLAAALTVHVGLMRGRKRINLGDGGDAEMQAAVRAHGNLMEFAPLTLLTIYMASDFYGFRMVAALSVALLVARVLHAGGMLGLVPKGRLMGTVASCIVLGIASILLAIAGLGLKQY